MARENVRTYKNLGGGFVPSHKHSMLTSARYATMYSQILSAMLSSDGGKTAAVAEDDSIDARAVWGGMRHAALTSLETLQYEATTFVMF